jgi:hypothetical protein
MSFITNPLTTVENTDKRTPAKKEADQIGNVFRQSATQLLQTYKNLMRLVYQNPSAKKEDIVACFSNEELLAMRQWACITKTILNRAKPGTIVDIIPEVTITFPEKLFPE